MKEVPSPGMRGKRIGDCESWKLLWLQKVVTTGCKWMGVYGQALVYMQAK